MSHHPQSPIVQSLEAYNDMFASAVRGPSPPPPTHLPTQPPSSSHRTLPYPRPDPRPRPRPNPSPNPRSPPLTHLHTRTPLPPQEKGKEEAEGAARAAGVDPSELHIEACAICCDDIILGPYAAVLKMNIPEVRDSGDVKEM